MITILTLREKILKAEKKKLRKKVKRDVRVAKEAESSCKDKKKTRKERVMVTTLEDQAGVMILTDPPFLGPPQTILTVVSGTHFS